MHAGATTEHLTDISIQISWLLRSLVSEPSAQISLSWLSFGLGQNWAWLGVIAGKLREMGLLFKLVVEPRKRDKANKSILSTTIWNYQTCKDDTSEERGLQEGKGLIESSSFVEMRAKIIKSKWVTCKFEWPKSCGRLGYHLLEGLVIHQVGLHLKKFLSRTWV